MDESNSWERWFSGSPELLAPEESWQLWRGNERANWTLMAVGKEMVRLEVGENRDRYEPENFSSWSRLIKVRAWILRFVRNCRKEEFQRR